MANYYIDYENVHNEGLKGIKNLDDGDRLYLFYSNKADTLKIDMVRLLLNCTAEIHFEKIENGTENALDFQLIIALMCNYSQEEHYYIISRDKGYDAAIEMAIKQQRGNIYRCRDIDAALKHQAGLGIDESDQEVIVDLHVDSEPISEISVFDAVEDAAAIMSDEENVFELELDDDGTEAEFDAAVEARFNSLQQAMANPVEDYLEDDDSPEAQAAAEEELIYEAVEPEIQLEAKAKKTRGRRRTKAQKQQDEDLTDNQIATEPDEAQSLDESAQAQLQNDSEEQEHEESPVETEEQAGTEIGQDELARRAYQSICTKLLNHIKLTHKIPVTYKQAGTIYEALCESETKMQFYRKLVQFLGKKKGGELYKKIKPAYKSFYAIYKAATDHAEADSAPVEMEEQQEQENVSMEAAVEDIKNAFEDAEQYHGNPGEHIVKLAELVKNI